MPFKPGISGNPKGKPAGTKSKTTIEIRELFQMFLGNNVETMQANFELLEPVQKLTFIEKIAKLVMPPPTTLENLSDEQLDLLIQKLKENEKN